MAANYPKLTEGAITRIASGEKVEKPVLQIIIYKEMKSPNSTQTKYRFQLSDGVETGNAFIVVLPELIQRISRGEFEKFTVVQLTSYSAQDHQQMNRQIILINDMTCLMSGSKIGRRLSKSEPNVGFLSNANKNGSPLNNRSANPAVSSSTSPAPKGNVCPIVAITPYFNAWLIRARVTSKANKKNWSNARGEGSVFSFDVMDESGEIRINAFNNECNTFYDLIQPNKVYYISKGTVKTANKRFSNLANDYEITLNSDSLVEECSDTSIEVPKLRYKFIQIKDLANVALNSVVDVIGIVKSVEEVSNITSKKTNKELKKRDITVLDNSAHEVRFTLWNEAAEEFNCELSSVIAIKNAIVGEYQGRTLGSVSNTTLQIEPEIPETHLLKEWFSREGSSITTQSLNRGSGEIGSQNQTRLLCQINEQTVPPEDKVYFNTMARIVQTGQNRTPLYKACGQNGCMKKVRDNNNGFYHCDKCQVDTPNFQWRLILQVAISDCTAETWISIFQETAEKLLGISTQELAELQENNPQQFQKALSAAEFKKLSFRMGARVEHYMEERRVKSVAYSFSPIDPIKHSKQLIQNIRQWTK